jgi:RNA polymerase sigma factor for flagellar operon FliA
MNLESLYKQHLALIERIARNVAHRHHLNPDDCAEFVQVVRVRLFDDDYAILRKFEGRSSMSTYLTTVIGRLYNEWRVGEWGKWRPSAEAKRLGNTAITLERLLTRDGMTFSEAVNQLTTRSGPHPSVSELEALYARLPPRNSRPVVVSGEVSPDAVAVEAEAGDRIEASDRERTARLIAQTIDSMSTTLGAEDRLILQLRFWNSRKVPEIASVVNIDAKKIYKRLEKLFAVLRRALEAVGIGPADIALLLARGDHDIHLNLLKARENGQRGPSNNPGKEVRGRKGRLS